MPSMAYVSLLSSFSLFQVSSRNLSNRNQGWVASLFIYLCRVAKKKSSYNRISWCGEAEVSRYCSSLDTPLSHSGFSQVLLDACILCQVLTYDVLSLLNFDSVVSCTTFNFIHHIYVDPSKGSFL